ncbi:RNase H domain-containing protein, partial [Aphis craccivora]
TVHVVNEDTIIQYKLPEITSIFSAENYAIYEGVKLANTLEPNDILIISDSLSTLLSLKKICPKNEITSNTQAILIQTRKNIEFMWVPSHTGIVGNEKADKYAYLATNSFQNPKINNVPTNDIQNSIKQKILLAWQNYWNSIPSSNKLKSVKKTTKKWNTPSNFNRRQDIAITRTRIGHSFLTHSYLISKEPQPICDTCHTALTIKHIVVECTKYSQTRSDLNISPNIAEALAENQTSKIIQFLNITNLIKKL